MKFAKFILGFTIFVVVVSWSTLYLQRTLVLYRATGWHVHWGAILLFGPLLVGLTHRLLKVPLPLLVSLLGGAASATIVYPEYRDVLFREPPHPLAAVIFAVITAGVSYSATIRLGEKLTVLKRYSGAQSAVGQVVQEARSETPRKTDLLSSEAENAGDSEESTPRSITSVSESPGDSEESTPRSITSILLNPRYAAIIAGLQLLVAVFSLMLSIISILVLGG